MAKRQENTTIDNIERKIMLADFLSIAQHYMCSSLNKCGLLLYISLSLPRRQILVHLCTYVLIEVKP